MEAEKTFIGTSPSKIHLRKKDFLWAGSIWIGFIILSYWASSFIPIIVLAVVFIFSLLMRLRPFQRKIYIKIGGGTLSVHSRNAVLWKSHLTDITSIDLEDNCRAQSAVSGKALLIRNNEGDSYYLPLGGITFEGLKPESLVKVLNEIMNNARQMAEQP